MVTTQRRAGQMQRADKFDADSKRVAVLRGRRQKTVLFVQHFIVVRLQHLFVQPGRTGGRVFVLQQHVRGSVRGRHRIGQRCQRMSRRGHIRGGTSVGGLTSDAIQRTAQIASGQRVMVVAGADAGAV